MTIRKRIYAGVAVVALTAGSIGAVAAVTHTASAGGSGGNLDDGKELLPQAKISLADATARAQAAAPGDVGEVDLEYYNGKLVFNVDVGTHDVKVDANTGELLGSTSDD